MLCMYCIKTNGNVHLRLFSSISKLLVILLILVLTKWSGDREGGGGGLAGKERTVDKRRCLLNNYFQCKLSSLWVV